MKNTIICMLLLSTLLIYSCNGSSEKTHEPNSKREVEIIQVKTEQEVNENFKTFLDDYFKNYLQLQSALAHDDATKALETINLINQQLKHIDTLSSSDSIKASYDKYFSKIKSSVLALTSSSNITDQRAVFETVSINTFELAKQFGWNSTLYNIYCPMALDGKGASWLSSTEKVENPYYGSDMYSCGYIKEIIKTKKE